MSKAKPRLSAMSKAGKPKPKPTPMQTKLKQNLHKVVIHENKLRSAARDSSQTTASKRCKKNQQYYQNFYQN